MPTGVRVSDSRVELFGSEQMKHISMHVFRPHAMHMNEKHGAILNNQAKMLSMIILHFGICFRSRSVHMNCTVSPPFYTMSPHFQTKIPTRKHLVGINQIVFCKFTQFFKLCIFVFKSYKLIVNFILWVGLEIPPIRKIKLWKYLCKKDLW